MSTAATALAQLQERNTQRRSSRVRGLAGIAAAEAVWQLSATRPVVWVCATRTEADERRRDLLFLAGRDQAEQILLLPADDRTPYHHTSPDPLVVMERSATMFKLATGAPFRVLVVPAASLQRRQVPFAVWEDKAELLGPGATLDRDMFAARLVRLGYAQVNTVEDKGSFAVRGSIVDVFWPGHRRPVRIDLFGDEIETVKWFDPSTQRAAGDLEMVAVGPAREVHLDDDSVERAVQALRDRADQCNFPTKRLRTYIEDLQNRIPFFGIEGLLPAFHPPLLDLPAALAQGLGDTGFSVFIDDEEALGRAFDDEWDNYATHRATAEAKGKLTFPESAFLLTHEELNAALAPAVTITKEGVVQSSTDVIDIRTADTGDLRKDILKASAGHGVGDDLFAPLVRAVRRAHDQQRTVLFPCQALGGVERLIEVLSGKGLAIRRLSQSPDVFDASAIDDLLNPSVHGYAYVADPVLPSRGGALAQVPAVVVTEEDIFGKRARRGSASRKRKGFSTTVSDLNEGDYVVHVDFGVALFKGLTRLNLRGTEIDFLQLHYAGDDKVYVPVHRINLVQRYAGADGRAPRLDKLGGTGWATKKKKVKKAVLAMAQELLHIYAQRELANRPACKPPDEHYIEFESRFPFETTVDQQKAIDDCLGDLQSERPMDRLVCGDVGYGKTEVGMRAAMLAVAAGRQVAVLAPTTVLTQQHFLTFTERFEGLPVTIEMVSRFRTAKETKEILQRTKEGKIDILIGTHRLLSNDVNFKQLGLVIVDEEQRFGVKSKEKLKKLRADVDVLTLTATPIPRTLQMGFFGVRDLSVIETPPVDRRAIRTQVVRFDDELIREGIWRELSRGGQVYFVHNRVRSIAAIADYIKRLVPESRIGIGHGQMKEDELEAVMLKFLRHEINVLVCTTIIETGIDVPTANTMFIDHADDFGLSQLYQLRGRVGRSKDRAFAYLLVPAGEERLTADAQKRLDVLQRFSELGAGFKIAQHDLELRGAGDMLGKSQHGHITAVGYDMYAELLKEAVEDLRGRAHDDVPDPDINVPVQAFIPEKFIADVHERLQIYQRLATAKDTEGIYDVVGEVGERYGEPPVEFTTLADVMVLKRRLREMAARALDVNLTPAASDDQPPPPPKVVITLGEQTKLNVDKLAELVTSSPEKFRLTPNHKLVVSPEQKTWDAAGHDVIPLCRGILHDVLHRAA